MSKLILFFPDRDYAKETFWSYGTHACASPESIHSQLAYHLYPKNKNIEIGHRTIETKRDRENPKQSFFRKSPWIVEKIENYPADILGYQKYEEITICYCKYAPIAESENPWIPVKAYVSPDSFDGDLEAYREFCASPSSQQYECLEVEDWLRVQSPSID